MYKQYKQISSMFISTKKQINKNHQVDLSALVKLDVRVKKDNLNSSSTIIHIF